MARRKLPHRIVPSLVLGAAFVGVVPACVLTACGGTETTVKDAGYFGVAAVAYCCFDGGVADVGFRPDAGDAADGSDAVTDAPADAAKDAAADAKGD